MYKLLEDNNRNTNSLENKVAHSFSNEQPHSKNVMMTTNHLSKVLSLMQTSSGESQQLFLALLLSFTTSRPLSLHLALADPTV